MVKKRSSKSDKTPSPQLLHAKNSHKQLTMKSLKLKTSSNASNKSSRPHPHRKQNSMGIVVSPPHSPKSPYIEDPHKSPFAIATKQQLKKSIHSMPYQRSNPRIMKQKSNAISVHRNSTSYTDDYITMGRKRQTSTQLMRDRFNSMDDYHVNLNLKDNVSGMSNGGIHHNRKHSKGVNMDGAMHGHRGRNPTLTFEEGYIEYDRAEDGSSSEEDDDHEDTGNDFNTFLDRVTARKSMRAKVCSK